VVEAVHSTRPLVSVTLAFTVCEPRSGFGIEALGPLAVTPFATGVRRSVEIYQAQAATGRLDAEQHGLAVGAPT